MCDSYKTRVRVRELGFKEDRTLSLKLCFTSPHWLNGSITTRNVYCLCCCCVSFAIYSYWVVCWISKLYYILVWLKSQALQSDFNVSWQFCAVWWGQDHSSLTNISSCSESLYHLRESVKFDISHCYLSCFTEWWAEVRNHHRQISIVECLKKNIKSDACACSKKQHCWTNDELAIRFLNHSTIKVIKTGMLKLKDIFSGLLI